MKKSDLENQILKYTEERGLIPHQLLPTRVEIAARWGVNNGVVDNALKALAAKGHIYSIPGKGAFVSPYKKMGHLVVVMRPWVDTSVRFSDQASFLMGCVTAGRLTVSMMQEAEFEQALGLLPHIYPDLMGVVVFRYPDTLARHGDLLRRRGIPCWFYGSDIHKNAFVETSACFHREHDIAATALDHLWARGHRRIAMLHDPHTVSGARRQGWLRWMKRRGMEIPPALDLGLGDGTDALPDLERLVSARKKNKAYTAVFASSDHQGIRMASLLKKAGLRVPEDVALVGVNNEPASAWTQPSLTTVDIPLEGDARRIVAALGEGNKTPITLTSDIRLIPREST